jgi:protein O-GlcNAc transferase
MSNTVPTFGEALVAFNNRDLKRAEELFWRVIELDKSNVPALNFLVVTLMSMGRFAEAEPLIERAIELDQSSDVSFYNYGLIAKQLNKPRLAHEQLTKALKLNPTDHHSWNNRGIACNDLKQHELAVTDFDKAIELHQNFAEGHANKGKSLTLLRRYDEAFAAYDKALSIKPDLEGAWLGRGNVCWNLKRYDEALDAFAKALSIKPQLQGAWLGLGNVFTDLKRHDEALSAYDKSLSLKPDLAEAWLGRGNVFWNLKRYDETLAAYDQSLSIQPDLAEACAARGNVFTDIKRHDEAFAAYEKALSINLHLDGVEGARLHAKMNLCNWKDLKAEIGSLTTSIKSSKANSAPFAFLSLSDSSADQLCCSKTWVATKHPEVSKHVRRSSINKHEKIRIGYVSADFHEHATAYLMAELFELHDRRKFAVFAFSLGSHDNSATRQRLVSSFDLFADCRNLSDADVIKTISDAEVDILLDLKGYTQDARTNIFAHRPAPIQVNYLGYPGSMGASYIDYIIGDKILFADSERAVYSEKLVHLPHSYQPNDRKRLISDRTFTRSEFNLPESSFVFCCFNNNYKIMPDMFHSWMRILKAVDGSVLWLIAENQTAMANLKKEAVTRGINEGRLVFANRMKLPDHLARHRLADLFLDTLPYNAHTTASDALWAGLPILTQIGGTFAGRVAASLLNAIDLPELITHSREEYETLAIDLALNREKLKTIREKLARNRTVAPLFDTALYTRHLEAAYEAMYQRYKAGLPPDHLEIVA